MTQEEIIDMAEQAGFDCYGEHITWDDVICTNELKAFAKLVAAKEREDVIQHLRELKVLSEDGTFTNEIRARGQA
jgi:hypothetical protein